MSDVRVTVAGGAQAYPEALRMAEALAAIHGAVVLRQEARGLHAYMASPECISTDGRKELVSKHLSVNLDRYFGKGKFMQQRGTYNRDSSGLCMKTKKIYLVSELLEMPALELRGIPDVRASVFVSSIENEKKRMTDEYGRRVPAPPGDVTPILQLEPTHPARAYLEERGYDLQVLTKMFDVSYCYRELPRGTYERYYRKGPDGWYDTPQNRIIFYGLIEGSRVGWQARLIQKKGADGWTYFLHPYRNDWVPVEYHYPDGSKHVRPDYGVEWKQISKYKTADAMLRNEVLFGLDAAVEWNRQRRMQDPTWMPTCFANEGPLDSGRIGPPALCLTGKYVSPEQIKILARHFRRAISVMDNDKGGEDAEKSFLPAANSMILAFDRPPSSVKDIGETPQAAINQLRKKYGC